MTDMSLQFTDEEIRQQLQLLGFTDVSPQQFFHFKNELQELLEGEALGKEDVDSSVSGEEKCSQNEGNDLDVVQIKYEGKNVLIEKLSPKSFDRSKFASKINLVSQNKENCGNNFEEPQMQSYSWKPTLFKTKSKTDDVEVDDTSASLTSSRQRKRKVLRKKHGKVTVEVSGEELKSNEETTEDEICSTQSRLNSNSDSLSSNDVPKRWRSVCDLGITKRSIYRSKSVLLPYTNNTQAHIYYKSDPVALFHYYKREWSNCNIPGEKDHKELRWNIRQALNMGFTATASSSSSRLKVKSNN